MASATNIKQWQTDFMAGLTELNQAWKKLDSGKGKGGPDVFTFIVKFKIKLSDALFDDGIKGAAIILDSYGSIRSKDITYSSWPLFYSETRKWVTQVISPLIPPGT